MSTFFVHVRTCECIRSGVLGKERNPVKHARERRNSTGAGKGEALKVY